MGAGVKSRSDFAGVHTSWREPTVNQVNPFIFSYLKQRQPRVFIPFAAVRLAAVRFTAVGFAAAGFAAIEIERMRA